MKKKTNRDYLNDMLEYILRVERSTKDGKAAFFASTLIQDAVIRQYEVIGEIAKRLSASNLLAQSDVDWKTLINFRDFLAHNYDRVDLEIVWRAIEKLPELRAAVEVLLNNLPPDENMSEVNSDERND